MSTCGTGCLKHIDRYPGFEGRQSQSDPDRSLVGVHYRVVVDVAVVAHSDWLVVVLMNAVESVDWFWRKRWGEGG